MFMAFCKLKIKMQNAQMNMHLYALYTYRKKHRKQITGIIAMIVLSTKIQNRHR